MNGTAAIRVMGTAPLLIKTPGVFLGKQWWKAYLPDRSRIWAERDDAGNWVGWGMSAKHLETAIYALRGHPGINDIQLWNRYRVTQACSDSCQSATRALCECSCRGLNHGGGSRQVGADAPIDWEIAIDAEWEWIVRSVI